MPYLSTYLQDTFLYSKWWQLHHINPDVDPKVDVNNKRISIRYNESPTCKASGSCITPRNTLSQCISRPLALFPIARIILLNSCIEMMIIWRIFDVFTPNLDHFQSSKRHRNVYYTLVQCSIMSNCSPSSPLPCKKSLYWSCMGRKHFYGAFLAI